MRPVLLAKALGIISCLGVMATAAQAADYPTKPIKITVGYGAGGGTDAFVRAMSESMAKSLGQPVLVTNRPGAGGGVSAMAVKSEPADGYNLVATGSVAYTFEPQVLKTKYTYKDFDHIYMPVLFQ
ncbi:MAG: Bug family tripartite tricarboxylate transporter substrate binding protein, partial [Hyphomicrobiaceae bacterium]